MPQIATSWRRDNIFVERLWRSIKYEEVYLRGYDSMWLKKRDFADRDAIPWGIFGFGAPVL